MKGDAARQPVRAGGGAWAAGLALLLAPAATRALALVENGAVLQPADLRGVAADLGAACLCGALLLVVARASRLLAVVGALGLAALYVANYESLRALRAVLRFADAHYLADPTFLGGSALALSHPIATLALLCATGWLAWRGFAPCRSGGRSALALGAAGALLLGALAGVPASPQTEAWRQVNVLAENLRALVRPSPAGDAGRAALLAAAPELGGDLSGALRLPLGARGRNVLLVVLEGVSGADLPSLAAAHARHSVQPLLRLDRIARENVAYATFVNHNRRTDRGLYALLCGELPSLVAGMSKMTVAGSAGASADCLPGRLRDLGYRTVYLQAAPLAFMGKDRFLPRAGFERVLGSDWFRHANLRTLWGVDDRAFFEQAAELVDELERRGEPWFVTLLTVGTHHPYVVPAGAQHAGGAGAAAAFAELDAAIGAFAERLEASGVREDTLVLITSDEAAGLWPGSDDGLVASLTQSWGFLAALLPGRERALVTTPYAQSDLALSVLDYLGEPAAAQHFFGRSLFREPAASRHVFFGNVNLGTLGALAPDGHVLLCSGTGEACRGYDSLGGRLFAPRLTPAPPPVALEALAREVAAASRPAREATSLSLELARAAEFQVDQRDWQLVHGTPVALAPGEWLEVELALTVAGDGVVELEHALRFPRRRDALRLPLQLAAGQALELRYTLAAGEAVPRITCQTQARLVEGWKASLDFSRQRLIVRRGANAPPPGVSVTRFRLEPPGAADGPPALMTAAELDRIARSMHAGGEGLD